MGKTIIKNLIFDLGNVIIDLDFHATESRLHLLTGISFINASSEDQVVFDDFECGRIPEEIFLNYLIRKSNGKAQAIDLIQTWNAMLGNLPKERLMMMKSLMKDYRVYILSNTNETHIRWVDNYLASNYGIKNLSEVCHHAFYSQDLKCRKPEVEIYEKVMGIANIEAHESIFFDDNQENIRAAKRAGLHGVLVDPLDEILRIVPATLAELDGKKA